MDLYILDNSDSKFFKNKNSRVVYLSENLSNKNSIKYLIELEKKEIRREISFLLREKIKYNCYKTFIKEDEHRLLWEMSSISELNVLRSKSFFKLAQIICLKNIVKRNKYKKIYYFGSLDYIRNFLSCIKNDSINIKINNLELTKKKKFFLIRALFFFLKYFLKNFTQILKRVKKRENQKELIFLSYLVHINFSKKIKNFSTNHWGNIAEIVNLYGSKIKWIYDFTPSHQIKNISEANSVISRSKKNDINSHSFLSNYLNIFQLFKIFLKFFKYYLKFKLSDYNKFFKIYSLYNFNISKLFEDEIKDSFKGSLLISNLIYIEIFKSFTKKLDNSSKIFFLLENLPWEKALIHSLKKKHSHKLYGFINTPVIFWDMRFYNHNSKENFNYIDNILINEKIVKNSFKNIIKNKFICIESIRYNHLLNYKIKKKKNYNKILIIGEQSIENTYSCLKYFFYKKILITTVYILSHILQ